MIVARGADGSSVHFPCAAEPAPRSASSRSRACPAPDVTPDVQQQAIAAAGKIAATLGYVGVLCVEFFVLKDGSAGGQ